MTPQIKKHTREKYMDDNGTYLGNIYGIYMECITNISIDIYDIKYRIITHTHTPNGAAAEDGRPTGGAVEGGDSVSFISGHLFSIL